MNRLLSPLSAAALIGAIVAGCSTAQPSGPATTDSKIKFSLDRIRPDGLRGPPDGLVSVAYEFCVPAGEAFYQQVRQIDPSVKFYPGSRGRIGCAPGQALCIGETHQPGWRQVLLKLAAQPYIAEIRECYFE